MAGLSCSLTQSMLKLKPNLTEQRDDKGFESLDFIESITV